MLLSLRPIKFSIMTRNALLLLLLVIGLPTLAFSQTGTIRGNVLDKDSGEPIIFGTVRLDGTTIGTNTDVEGFFSLSKVPVGSYKLVASYVGYDSTVVEITVREGQIVYEQVQLSTGAVDLEVVNISARRERARTEVQISQINVTPEQIKSLPSTGGEPDIAQYLPVLPGIISTGDQGGQLYIRGGSPVQNKVLLDGMTIYNPFHSIGFFSVFETEVVRNIDVLTGGFNAEHGGRVSAIVDIKTREGNKKRLSGLVSASPFQAKALIEGPIIPLSENGGSTSFILTGKHSYLDQTSKALYSYAVDTSLFSFSDTTLAPEDIGLPYRYTDLYGKLSFVGGNGSKLNLFGFNFSDQFELPSIAELGWDAFGVGGNFNLVPPNSNIIINGTIGYSDYTIELQEDTNAPRRSNINNYLARLDFVYYGANSELNYGFEFNGLNTNFTFQNTLGTTIEQREFNTELSGYIKYKQQFGPLIIEPGLRLMFYASLAESSFEPRLGLKYNITDNIRIKAAGGLYSQNLISTVSELDVVNLFVGFLAGPEEDLPDTDGEGTSDTNLQTAIHGVAGVEIDLKDNLSVNIEPYYKGFTQLIALNRNKLRASDPDFVTETGEAYGIDFSVRYQTPQLYLWATYSLGYVNRDDGEQTFPTVFDRRHNVNLLGTYAFGSDRTWEASLRWNFGTGFPFTQTQGFYQEVPFNELLLTNILTGNFNLGTILSDERNGGRLSTYHRLDASLKKRFDFGKNTNLEVILSVTNVYNRENIFFVDRISNSRVNQLPILPSLGVTFHF